MSASSNSPNVSGDSFLPPISPDRLLPNASDERDKPDFKREETRRHAPPPGWSAPALALARAHGSANAVSTARTNGVLEREDTTLGLGLVTDVRIFLSHADHYAGLARAANDRGEDRAGRVIASEAGLAHAGAVVNHQSRDLILSHD